MQSHGLVLHCVKSVQVPNFFWSVFSCVRTEYGDLLLLLILISQLNHKNYEGIDDDT